MTAPSASRYAIRGSPRRHKHAEPLEQFVYKRPSDCCPTPHATAGYDQANQKRGVYFKRSRGLSLPRVLAGWPAAFLGTPAAAQKAGASNPVAMPGFWDPRRRPERPDLSRVTLIRFLTENDYPPFNYAGPDGNPAGFNVDLARMVCEELKIACTIQMRRFDTLIDSLAENRGDAVIASIAITAQTPQPGGFQRSLLPHAGALRGEARSGDRRRPARAARRQEGRRGRRHRA